MDPIRHFPEVFRQRARRYQRERRAVLLVTLGMGWVFWLAFGVLGCAVGLRDRLLGLSGGRLEMAAAAAAGAYGILFAAVLGPMVFLSARIHPRVWGLSLEGSGAWLRHILGRLALAAVLVACAGVWIVHRPDLAWLALASGVAAAGIWGFRGRWRLAALWAPFSLGLGWVGHGLLRHAALRGLWGITGVEDPAAWPLLAVVLSLVALPGIPVFLALSRRAALAEDAVLLRGKGAALFVTSRVREAEQLLLDVDPPAWVERWLSPTPPVGKRIALAEALAFRKELS
jgi:hypothetical protein